MKRLDSIGEDHLIQSLIENAPLKEHIVTGPGDDCAVIQAPATGDLQLLKTDSVIEGSHFLADTPPYWIGWKATARVVSDFAAMGGKPDALMVAIAVAKEQTLEYVKSIYEGIYACARQFDFSIVGGETSTNDKTILTISGLGICQKAILRSGAMNEDSIFVTGELGGSILGKHLNFTPRLAESQWLVSKFPVSSMMDLSDGLGKDLPRLAKASQLGYDIDFDSLPCNKGSSTQQAISDGEDYELLFTCSAKYQEALLSEWKKKFPDLKLTQIGNMTQDLKTPLEGGWEHFT